MNTKRKSETRTGNKTASMLLLLFISILGLYISGNLICYVGILYASAKIAYVLRPYAKRLHALNALSMKFRFTGMALASCLLMLFVGMMMVMTISPDREKITMVPKSNIYSHDFWKIKNVITIQNHPIMFFVVADMSTIIGLLILITTRFKDELMMVQNMIEHKSKEISHGIPGW